MTAFLGIVVLLSALFVSLTVSIVIAAFIEL